MRDAAMIGTIDRADFRAEVGELTAVYGAAMLPPKEHLAGRRSMMERHTYHPQFRAVVVRPGAAGADGASGHDHEHGHSGGRNGNGNGQVIAFCYGFRGAAGQWWHDVVRVGLTTAAGERTADAWLADSFEIAEVHVRPEFQRRGIGRAMLLRLTQDRAQRTALLSTQDLPSPARHLYRSLGFTDLLTGFCFPGGGPPYAVMGAALPLAASASRLPPSPSRW
ncbi:MAG: GNAT family N-acetyltransferase [Actinomycetota bacterium]